VGVRWHVTIISFLSSFPRRKGYTNCQSICSAIAMHRRTLNRNSLSDPHHPRWALSCLPLRLTHIWPINQRPSCHNQGVARLLHTCVLPELGPCISSQKPFGACPARNRPGWTDGLMAKRLVGRLARDGWPGASLPPTLPGGRSEEGFPVCRVCCSDTPQS
jgi:hypothetical protein